MPKTIETNNFRGIKSKLDRSYLIKLEKQIRKIIEKGTREVYVGSFRLAYTFFKSEDKLIFLDFYHKDKQ